MAIYLQGGTLIDGTGNPPVSDAVIKIEGKQITRLSRGQPTTDNADTIFNLAGKTIMPGMINCHEHLTHKRTYKRGEKRVEDMPTDMILLRSTKSALAALLGGITTVRDVCGINYTDVALRNAINQGTVAGPRMFVAGKGLMTTGALDWRIGREADGPDEMRKAVREQLKVGADLIKLFAGRGGAIPKEPTSPEFTVDEMKACVEEAHKANRKVAVHAGGRLAIEMAVELGVDSVEHGTYLSEEMAKKMAARGIFLCPTLSTGEYWIERADAMGEPPDLVELMKKNRGAHLQSTVTAIQSQVKITVGTDTGGTMVREMQLLMQSGLSAMDVIVAATKRGAELIGVEDRLGTLEPGKSADILVVDGDPLRDIQALCNLEFVIKEGVVFKPKDLAQLVA